MKLSPFALAVSLVAVIAPACTSAGSADGSTAGSAGSAPVAGAQGSTHRSADFRPIAPGDTLYVWSAGADALLVDAKDRGVRDALHHLGTRLLELPAEIGDPEFPADAIELAASALLGPMTLSVGPARAGEDATPVRARMTFRGATPAEARRRADQLTAVLAKYGVPSLGVDEATGVSVLDLGGFQLRHGIARDGRADVLLVGTDVGDQAERDLGTLDLPSGVKPAAAFRMDYGSLADILETFGGPEASAALASMRDVVVQGGFGFGSDRSHGAVRMIDWVPLARETGTLPGGSIESDAIRLVPKDATIAVLARTDFGGAIESMRGMTEMGAGLGGESLDPLALVREMTGVDLEQDVLAHVGETAGFYTSDSTGGGGYFSSVAFVRVTNDAALRATIERLEGRLEDYAADQGMPGLTLRHAQHAGADVTTLAFSGWPIPLEPSWAIRDGWLFASASLQGLRAALDQAAKPKEDLTDNERFHDQVAGSLDDLVSLTFVDVGRLARDGYPVAAMLGAAMSNGLTSAGDPERVPSGIVPGFGELTRGARSFVALGRIDGDDLVVRSQGDRSFLVQLAGMTGAVGPLPMLLGGAIAAGADKDDEADEVDFAPEMDESMPDEMEPDEMSEDVDVDDLITDPPPGDPK